SVRAFTSATAARSSVNVMVPAARMPRAPALLVAATRRCPATQPMPVCTIGCSTPSRSHKRVCSGPFTRSPHLGDTHVAGVEHISDQVQLVVGGRARLLNVVVHDQPEAGRRDDVV